MDSKTDHLAVTEATNVDEAIPIDLKKEKRNRHIKIQWKWILKRSSYLKRENK